MTDRRPASEIISDMQPDVPVQPASSLLDPEAMRRQGEAQDCARQDIIDRVNETSRPALR